MKQFFFVLLMFCHLSSFSQKEESRIEFNRLGLTTFLDSIAKDAMSRGASEVVCFGMLGYEKKQATAIWKYKGKLKGKSIYYNRGNVVVKHVRSSVLRKIMLDSFFLDSCDLNEIMTSPGQAYVSHDFEMYLGRWKRYVLDEVFFTYGKYLNEKDGCVNFLKHLISL
jgi:hypothetical protein